MDDETVLEETPLVVRRRVKWGDTDAAGVAYTPRFLHFAVEAAESWFKALTGEHWFHYARARGIQLPPIAAHLEFHHALWPDDRLALTVRVTGIGRSSHTVTVDGHNQDGTHCFAAEITFVCIDPAAREPQPMPTDLAEKLRSYQAACGS